MTMTTSDGQSAERARHFDTHLAPRLRALAYRMLGSRAAAEDILQEAWLRWVDVDESTVQHAPAFLSRLVTNLCLDELRSAAARREQYVGVWLPEPLLDDETHFDWAPGPEVHAEFAQDVTVAFMLVLERLSPLERAAFLLRDVFDLDYAEIAGHLDRSEAACRQLISRARKSVKADYARHTIAKEESERLMMAFMHAVSTHDISALAALLSEDAVLLTDGGGKTSAVPRPLHGGALVARVFIGFASLRASSGWRLVPTQINGLPGCLILDDHAGGQLLQTVALAPAAEADHIGALYIQRNPDKLRKIAERLKS